MQIVVTLNLEKLSKIGKNSLREGCKTEELVIEELVIGIVKKLVKIKAKPWD